VETTNSTRASSAAVTTLPIKLPSRTPTRHGYHAGTTR
jgi:hypothetical protein